MQDEQTRERIPGASSTALGNHSRVAPSASRMLTSYLSDIEQLLDEQRWSAALREALDLPQIAVALSDPQLRASGEQIKAWCAEWIRPNEADSSTQDPDYARVTAAALAHVSHDEPATVPVFSLKRLRLRRHARTSLRGFSSRVDPTLDTEGASAVATCGILVEAARHWYAQSAVHDPTVQMNLARLAVLR